MCCGMEAFSAKMYHVLKSAQHDFNQGNVALFGDTEGKKCACKCVKNVHFHCAGQLLEKFPFGSHMT